MAYDKKAPISERQHLTTVAGFSGAWATFEGGDIEAKTEIVWDGGSKVPSVLTAPAETKNITVTRPYKPAEHAAICRKLAKQVGSWRTTVSRVDTDPDLIPIGSPMTYANALLVKLKFPGGDAASSNGSMLELEFAVSGMA